MENLDITDLKILKSLQQDASLTNVELAAKVSLSPSPTLARVKKLEAYGEQVLRVCQSFAAAT
jgi:Lrp/AsnC family leucine-responsive transcriptional regulator